MEKIMLASKSPRRKRLIAKIVEKFSTCDPKVREEGITHALPSIVAKRRANLKARKTAAKYPGCTIIAADTVIYFNKKIIGKPKNAQNARKMLSGFSGQRLNAVSAVAVFREGKIRSWAEKATVSFSKIDEGALNKYIRSGKWKGKAGGFNIEEKQISKWAKVVKGEPETVIGLPLKKLKKVILDEKN